MQPIRISIDVPANHWALTSGILDEAVELGILKGSTVDGTIYLRPDEQVTRAEVATMLMRLSGASADAWGSTNTSGWSDVPSGAWYTPALNWASAKGILNGSNGLVRPDDPVTRQELACMLSNYEMRLGSGSIEAAVDALAAFPDAGSVASWAQESVAWAAENGYMGGNGNLSPASSATRAETAKMVVLMARTPELPVPPLDGDAGVELPDSSSIGSAAVELALTFEGTPYTYGGASPEEGFDCSGLVMYVYQQFGISLPHTASGQLAALEKYGSRFVTDPDDLRYGDLVFFPGHVAFYVGDGEVFCAKVPGEPAALASSRGTAPSSAAASSKPTRTARAGALLPAGRGAYAWCARLLRLSSADTTVSTAPAATTAAITAKANENPAMKSSGSPSTYPATGWPARAPIWP